MGRHIFFKDSEEELKGPYSEREVQEWYREGRFHSQCLFQINDDSLVETPFVSLDELRHSNGIACPFAPVKKKEDDEKDKERDRRIERLELMTRKVPYSIEHLMDRLQNVEREISELQRILMTKIDELTEIVKNTAGDIDGLATRLTNNVQCMKEHLKMKEEDTEEEDGVSATAHSITVTDSSDGSTAISFTHEGSQEEHAMSKSVAKDIIDKVGRFTDIVKNTDLSLNDILKELAADQLAGEMLDILNRHAVARTTFFRMLVTRTEIILTNSSPMYNKNCNVCQLQYLHYKQELLHLFSSEHLHKDKNSIKNVVWDTFKVFLHDNLIQRWNNEDNIRLAEAVKRRKCVKDEKRLRPTSAFLGQLDQQISKLVDRHPNTSYSEVFRSSKGKNIMDRLRNNVSPAIPCCMHCDAVFSSMNEFFIHFISFPHFQKMNKDLLYVSLLITVYEGRLYDDKTLKEILV